MFTSYQERLKTFADWPEAYKNIAKRLAIMGQHSISEKNLSTKCIYCNETFSGWQENELPLERHIGHNPNKCVIFKLKYLASRKRMCEYSQKIDQEAEEYLNRKFMKMDITKEGLFLCMRCGCNRLRHECNGPVQSLDDISSLESAQFYIRYLNGEFIEQIDWYLKGKLNIKIEQRSIILNLLGADKTNICAFETLESFIERNYKKIYFELEKKMKSIENTAVENMYNESMLL
jgi:hypothetical protein